MKCPYCSADHDHVVDSRSMAEGASIRRRRECQECGKRFTTYEHLDEIPMQIIKRDGARESFDREKIARSLRIACRKRPIGEEKIQELTGAVEQKVIGEPEKEITSAKVGELVMEELRQVDQVAYVRFASVYRSFKDVTEFMEALSSLLSSEKGSKKKGSGKKTKEKDSE